MIWKDEYLFYMYPKILAANNEKQIQRLMIETDFDSPIAKAFKAAWDAALHRCSIRISQSVNDLSSI